MNPFAGGLGGLWDDLLRPVGRLFNKFLGKKTTGFAQDTINSTGLSKLVKNTVGNSWLWSGWGAYNVGKNAIQGVGGALQGTWNQKPDTFQSLSDPIAETVAWGGDTIFNTITAYQMGRRFSPNALEGAYARKVKNSFWGNSNRESFITHRSYANGIDGDLQESLYKATDIKFNKGTWQLNKGATAVAEGESAIKKFVKKEGLSSGFWKNGEGFLGHGLMAARYMPLQVGGFMATEYLVGKAANVMGAILDESINAYYNANKIYRDERQFNNPMMQQWQQQNYQSAAGSYESNGLSLARIYRS